MQLKLRNIDFIYDINGDVLSVNLRFDYTADDMNLNGFVKISKDEYDQNAGDIAALTNLALTKLKDRINS